MRCPKCQYIAFEGGDRCPNCGYELAVPAMAPHDEESELPLRTGEDVVGPPADFALGAGRAPAAAEGHARHRHGPAPTPDLPLFADGPAPVATEAPDEARPATRQGAHRRPSVEPQRRRPERQAATSPGSLPGFSEERRASQFRPAYSAERAEVPAFPDPGIPLPASLLRRGVALLVDVVLLGAIDASVIYFTLRVADLPLDAAGRLPLLPLAGFLGLLDGGYLVSFVAASGQTIGKMLTRVRVVGEDDTRVTLGSAIVRAAAYAISVLPLGLGCVPALLGAGRRTLHDRLAGTRVIDA